MKARFREVVHEECVLNQARVTGAATTQGGTVKSNRLPLWVSD